MAEITGRGLVLEVKLCCHKAFTCFLPSLYPLPQKAHNRHLTEVGNTKASCYDKEVQGMKVDIGLKLRSEIANGYLSLPTERPIWL